MCTPPPVSSPVRKIKAAVCSREMLGAGRLRRGESGRIREGVGEAQAVEKG